MEQDKLVVFLSKNLHIGENGGKVIIGKNSYINSGRLRAFGADIIIGKDCTIGYNIVMITSYGSHFLGKEKEKRIKPIVIGNNVWIGDSAMIRGGVTIGDWAVIGMGSVVITDVEAFHVYAGNPAKDCGLRPDYLDIMKKIRK